MGEPDEPVTAADAADAADRAAIGSASERSEPRHSEPSRPEPRRSGSTDGGKDRLASHHDDVGVPLHRGWAPIGGRHRWMEPFVLVVLATTGAHGYAITGELEEMAITGGPVDVGQVYRTLRDLEASGLVTSSWSSEPVGPQRREYELTAAGYAALDEWAAVMKERIRLIGEFDGRYLDAVARPRTPRA